MTQKSKRSQKKKKATNSTSRALNILVSNDDGVDSEGIQELAKALSKLGKVTVVAPEREQSTMGHALTLHKPVRLFKIPTNEKYNAYALSGTPADCVYVGIRYVLKKRPDIIVSGINRGVNVGNDIYFSGTIAAAREGAVLNIPAIATSLDYHFEPGKSNRGQFKDCAHFATKLAKKVLKEGIPEHSLLNVNFPSCPLSKVKGVKITRQGLRKYTDVVKPRKDNRKRPYFWLGGQYEGFQRIQGSDCVALDQNYISIMPCRLDVTDYEFMKDLDDWNLTC